MAAEKHYYIAPENLKEKYRGPSNYNRVESLVKAIQKSSGARVSVSLKKNNTIQFIATGGSKAIDRALRNINYEFEKPSPTIGTPHRSTLVFLEKHDHRRLQRDIKTEETNRPLLTEDALRKFDIMTGALELRQFACEPCQHPWWTYVPQTKPVSHCRRCHVKYNALGRHEEFGIGRYICLPCNRTFYARCEATEKHQCLECQKLTGPPYINPRFKRMPKPPSRHPRPRPLLRKIFNASTIHDPTGSTISSFLTQDLGSDIYVPLEYSMAIRDIYKPHGDDPGPTESPQFSDDESGDDDSENDLSSTIGEIGDLQEDSDSESDTGHGGASQKRAMGSGSESESDEEDDKKSISSSLDGSEPDSGVGTWSIAGSGNSEAASSSSSAKPSVSATCEFKTADYPGIAFSKKSFEAVITKKGGKIIGEGIKLSIPAGAVPDGDEVTISLQACIGGPFILPEKNMAFVSPVYLIQPPFAFRDNLKLSINMFVEFEDLDDLCFITSPTKKVLSESNEPQWIFRKFGSPTFVEEKRGRVRGTIHLKHFCFGAFAGNSRKKYSYCYSLYTPKYFHLPVTNAIFSVTIHHEVYIENLDRYVKAHFGSHEFVITARFITFSATGVHFMLPKENVLPQGYILDSDISPCKILKSDVDYPLQNKKRAIKDITLYPPKIVLQMRQAKRTTSDLNFQFKVEGIQEDISLNFSLTPSSVPSKRKDRVISSAPSTPSTYSIEEVSSEENPYASTPRSSTDSDSMSSSASSPGDVHTRQPANKASNSISHGRKKLATCASPGDGTPSSDIVRSSSHTSNTSYPSQVSSGYGSQNSQEAIDSKPNFELLYNELISLSHEWETIAINLGLVDEIHRIDKDGRNVNDKLKKVLLKWKSSCPKPYTWLTIVEVLEQPSLGENSRADSIRQQYCN